MPSDKYYHRKYRLKHIDKIREKDRLFKRNKRKNNPEEARKLDKKYFLRHRNKKLINLKLRDAVKKGIIVKSNFCENCGIDKNIQGHHPDYRSPLKVVWLCPPCHKKAHKIKSNGHTVEYRTDNDIPTSEKGS